MLSFRRDPAFFTPSNVPTHVIHPELCPKGFPQPFQAFPSFPWTQNGNSHPKGSGRCPSCHLCNRGVKYDSCPEHGRDVGTKLWLVSALMPPQDLGFMTDVMQNPCKGNSPRQALAMKISTPAPQKASPEVLASHRTYFGFYLLSLPHQLWGGPVCPAHSSS